jgi:hypothetical protein
MTKDSRQPTNTAHYNVLDRLDKLIEPKLVFIGTQGDASFWLILSFHVILTDKARIIKSIKS